MYLLAEIIIFIVLINVSIKHEALPFCFCHRGYLLCHQRNWGRTWWVIYLILINLLIDLVTGGESIICFAICQSSTYQVPAVTNQILISGFPGSVGYLPSLILISSASKNKKISYFLNSRSPLYSSWQLISMQISENAVETTEDQEDNKEIMEVRDEV